MNKIALCVIVQGPWYGMSGILQVFVNLQYCIAGLVRYDGMGLNRLVQTGVVVCVLPRSATTKK